MTRDDATTIRELRDVVRHFVDQRDWQQFHSPKNLSMSLAIEAAELMEHFQWVSTEASREPQEGQLEEVRDEVADVLCYLLAIANTLDLDLTSAMMQKMKKNEQKYPAEEYRGRFGPRDAGEPGGEKDR